jgi:CRISPR-associated protein Csx17
MTTHIVELGGCAPTPLASYLKALGVLRLVAEQADPLARGWWRGERFFLASSFDQARLVGFFAEAYRPSPLLSPWNKGAGFFLDNGKGVLPVEQSTAARFAELRDGIGTCRAMLGEIRKADSDVRAIKREANKLRSKAEKKRLREDPVYKRRLTDADRRFKELKDNFVPLCHRQWRGALSEWLSAATVMEEEKAIFPALLGTGGNDGRLDFTNNFLQRLGDLFDLGGDGAAREGILPLIRVALFGGTTRGLVADLAVGQFQPGSAGGANAGNGSEARSLVNPADFVLMMEGTLLFRTAITKRAQPKAGNYAAAPFSVPAHASGYSSASESDESARGEQWMPLWQRPSRLRELKHLLAEGRSRVGGKSAREPLQFARAIGSLGISRGIDSFQRFGFIERNGQSKFAVPLGRYSVPEKTYPQIMLASDVDGWAASLRRQAREKHAPARLKAAERRVTDALFGAIAHPAEKARWQAVLLALADAEAVLVSGSGFKVGAVPKLSPGWIKAADDGSAELRLAVACALQQGQGKVGGPVRRHWLPLKDGSARFDTRGDVPHQHLAQKPDVVMRGRDGLADAVALVDRRLVEGAQAAMRHLPLVAIRGAGANIGDLAAFAAGEVDPDRTMRLARALMAVDAVAWRKSPVELSQPAAKRWPDDAWVALRLALLPWPLGEERDPGCDPAIFRRLMAGDVASAVELALRRLRGAGLRCGMRAGHAPDHVARLWAAAFAFPVSRGTVSDLVRRFDLAVN